MLRHCPGPPCASQSWRCKGDGHVSRARQRDVRMRGTHLSLSRRIYIYVTNVAAQQGVHREVEHHCAKPGAKKIEQHHAGGLQHATAQTWGVHQCTFAVCCQMHGQSSMATAIEARQREKVWRAREGKGGVCAVHVGQYPAVAVAGVRKLRAVSLNFCRVPHEPRQRFCQRDLPVRHLVRGFVAARVLPLCRVLQHAVRVLCSRWCGS